MKKKYDVGIYGWWGHENFGGCLTYYALEKAVQKLGYSVLMIQEAYGYPGRYIIPEDTIAMKFANEKYDCSPQVHYDNLKYFNEICNRFIVGGDQLWNNAIPFVQEDDFLDFAEDNKILMSFATSFGNEKHNPPKDYVRKITPLLKRFDHISVREDYAVDLAKNIYGVNADMVLDAVFLLEENEYCSAIKNANYNFPKEYLFAFILDPSIEKRNQIESIAKKLNIEIICCPDAASRNHNEFNKVFEGLNILDSLSIDNFLIAYKNASYIVTDSFHGTCMSYVFKKNFSVYYNEKRGANRFENLMRILELQDRRIYETNLEEDIISNNNVGGNIEWENSIKNIEIEREKSIEWLSNALENKTVKPVDKTLVKAVNDLHSNSDFIKIRLLVTLLKDYGIKNVVLSPGGRDVPLVRMFEYNAEHFHLYPVTDERSAAYYGLGLAVESREPVVCVCTSGTAASNYLPAVTEAFYTGVPLIVITADRRQVYLNHGEDQTIPQKNIYADVVKKSITVPEGEGYMVEYQTRRDISECILEATHNGLGPVHINISVENIMIGARIPRESWKLLPYIHPHILRVGFNDGEQRMKDWVSSLKESPRILIVYGQNAQLTEEKRNIELFASRYNCVIVTDFISNLDCEYSIKPYNMLQSISQEQFNRELSPDILITVGGKQLMNDPLTFKIRGGLKNIRHWSVTPDGKVKDFYFRLTSVIEMSQNRFFEWFSNNSGNIQNDKTYLNKWRNLNALYKAPEIKEYNSHYVQKAFFPMVPSNSILHLGVGQSFYDCRRYELDSTVSVFCNMGTNGIDGCTSTFMGQCAINKEKLAFLLVGDLSFFYDMNSIWNKKLHKNIRILLVNNNGTGLLRGHNLKAISSVHNTSAEGWVKEVGFEYISASSEDEYIEKLNYFISNEPQKAIFFEVFCN